MRKSTIVVDLGFGDAGKGTTVDFLSRTRNIAAIIRFNGGGQAAHNVITPEGKHHTFSLFGSGMFIPSVRTHLSRFVMIDLTAIRNEAQHLELLGCVNPLSRLSIDEDAILVSPFQKAANRLRETLRSKNRHGSCGMGIGETMSDNQNSPALTVRARDLRNSQQLLRKLRAIQEMKREEFKESLGDLKANPTVEKEIPLLSDSHAPQFFAEAYKEISGGISIVSGDYLKYLSMQGELIFEGSQGVLLDEWYGFHPHTTWSTTTFTNALELLREVEYDAPVERLGVLRAYFTRHGAGPFPTEDQGLSLSLPDIHNGIGEWQGAFRVGWFDEVLVRYALAVCNGVDTLAITNLDRLAALSRNFICTAYENKDGQIKNLAPKSDLTDLSYQETLTSLLNQVVPIYREAPIDKQQYLAMVEENLRVPISITSCGPTALEKQLLQVASKSKTT